MENRLQQRVRQVLAGHARLAVAVGALDDSDDLYAAGMSSLSSMNVMIALEEAFGIEFPDRMLQRSTFSSIAAISSAVGQLAG